MLKMSDADGLRKTLQEQWKQCNTYCTDCRTFMAVYAKQTEEMSTDPLPGFDVTLADVKTLQKQVQETTKAVRWVAQETKKNDKALREKNKQQAQPKRGAKRARVQDGEIQQISRLSQTRDGSAFSFRSMLYSVRSRVFWTRRGT